MVARRSPLRAVTDAEKLPVPTSPMTVTQAVDGGSSRDQLVAMRARIARAIDDPNIRGADLAALTRRLLEIGRELDVADAARRQEAREGVEVPDESFDASAV